MRPMKDIYYLDVYEEWLTRSRWSVVDLCPEERMVKLVLDATLLDKEPFYVWKRNTDPIFNHRVKKGFKDWFSQAY